MAVDPGTLITALINFGRSKAPSALFGATVAGIVLAGWYDRFKQPWAVCAAFLFGGTLVYGWIHDAIRWGWKKRTERREQEQAKNAKELTRHQLKAQEQAKREAAWDNLTTEAQVRLLIEVLADRKRFHVHERDPAGRSLYGSPMVRFVGTSADMLRETIVEYKIRDWAWADLGARLAEVKQGDPEFYKDLEWRVRSRR